MQKNSLLKPRQYFPLGKAYGQSFCNRVTETQWLIGNLQNTKHTLLIAPRRYGKSSLAEKAIAETKLPSMSINFHLCTTEEEVGQLLVASSIKLIGKAIGQIEKTITSIKKYVSNLNPKLSFGEETVVLELTPKQHVNQAVIITETLLLVERLLRDKNKKAVLFLDEFQEITKINKSTLLEGAIRTAAQEMQNLSIIFSGSIRSLLLRMFDDESRPLYKLCRKLKLERIAAEDYKKHINKIAMATWKQSLDENVLLEIMALSDRHPYYVNYLCDVLWEQSDSLPTVESVKEAWTIVVEEEWSDAVKDISLLSLSQRKVLKFIAMHLIVNITSQETCRILMLPASTIASAVEVLLDKDYLEFNAASGYRIVNPILGAVLTEVH